MHHIIRGDAARIPLPDGSVDLVIGSPPYIKQRTYLENGRDLGIARDTAAWVAWMLGVTTEALRVSRGLVLWVVAGSTKDRCYQPGPEGLLWEWRRRGGHCLRPCYWHRVGIPGSGGDQRYRSDIEYVLAFKRPGKLPYARATANGRPPKYGPGGAMSHRKKDGGRVAEIRVKTERQADGSLRRQVYNPPEIANPGNLIRTTNGGGNLGSKLAHENEAPYPVAVPEFFIASHCPPGGLVLDPFGGSGTTAHAAANLGRHAIGMDLRQSQCLLARRRLRGVTQGMAFGESEWVGRKPLPGQTSFLDLAETHHG